MRISKGYSFTQSTLQRTNRPAEGSMTGRHFHHTRALGKKTSTMSVLTHQFWIQKLLSHTLQFYSKSPTATIWALLSFTLVVSGSHYSNLTVLLFLTESENTLWTETNETRTTKWLHGRHFCEARFLWVHLFWGDKCPPSHRVERPGLVLCSAVLDVFFVVRNSAHIVTYSDQV